MEKITELSQPQRDYIEEGIGDLLWAYAYDDAFDEKDNRRKMIKMCVEEIVKWIDFSIRTK